MTLFASQFPAFRNLPYRAYNGVMIVLLMIALVLLVMLYIPTRAVHLLGRWLTPVRAVVLGCLPLFFFHMLSSNPDAG